MTTFELVVLAVLSIAGTGFCVMLYRDRASERHRLAEQRRASSRSAVAELVLGMGAMAAILAPRRASASASDLNAQVAEVMKEYEAVCSHLDRHAWMAETIEFSRIRPPPGNQEAFIAFVRRRIEIVRLVYQVGRAPPVQEKVTRGD